VKLRNRLIEIARLIADQAEQDEEFAQRLSDVLGLQESAVGKKPAEKKPETKRPRNRRPAALIDPVAIIANGEPELRAQLSKLSLDQLRDIVADYGMDTSKLVMKWKDCQRVIDRIVEISAARAEKGNAFRA